MVWSVLTLFWGLERHIAYFDVVHHKKNNLIYTFEYEGIYIFKEICYYYYVSQFFLHNDLI